MSQTWSSWASCGFPTRHGRSRRNWRNSAPSGSASRRCGDNRCDAMSRLGEIRAPGHHRAGTGESRTGPGGTRGARGHLRRGQINQKGRIIQPEEMVSVVSFLGAASTTPPALAARRGNLGGQGRRRRQGGGRLRPDGTQPGRGRQDPDQPPDLRQHDKIHLHHHQRQLREHDQHGDGVALPPFLPSWPSRCSSTTSCRTSTSVGIAGDRVDPEWEGTPPVEHQDNPGTSWSSSGS